MAFSRRWALPAAAILVALQAPAFGQAPVPPPSAAPADDGQWTMPAKNYASTRYSELQEITGQNVEGH